MADETKATRMLPCLRTKLAVPAALASMMVTMETRQHPARRFGFDRWNDEMRARSQDSWGRHSSVIRSSDSRHSAAKMPARRVQRLRVARGRRAPASAWREPVRPLLDLKRPPLCRPQAVPEHPFYRKGPACVPRRLDPVLRQLFPNELAFCCVAAGGRASLMLLNRVPTGESQ